MTDTTNLTAAVRDVLAERERQVTVEGFTPERDDEYVCGDLAHAAGAYATSGRNMHLYPAGQPPVAWPWPASWWKPQSERRALVKAAALILAEIERLDRVVECKCKRLGDFDGTHHPLCDGRAAE